MKCPDRKTIESLVNKTLSPAAAARLETHLAECAKCRGYKASIERIGGLLKSSRPLLPEESYWKTLPERIKTREIFSREINQTLRLRAIKPRFASMAWLATVAAAFLIVVFSATLFLSIHSLKGGYSAQIHRAETVEKIKPVIYGNRYEYYELSGGAL